ncbi:MAG: 60S ribosomal protein L31 [Candidatus Aenigmatarchaeota archaeon]|nr:MAG: 60S ribosomal protein L31 [Candidatus Aenigmarchaeota archaeon]
MAEKTKTSDIERIYTITLRRDYSKGPRSKRSNRALRNVKEFVRKHTKTREIKISKGVNEFLFSRGFKKPPGSIKVEVEGSLESVQVKLPGEIIIKKEEKKKGIAGLRERLTGKPGEEKKEEPKKEEKPKAEEKEEKKPEVKEPEKKETKEKEEKK